MLGGSAKMGIKNHSENGMSLIREYEVTFSSSGTTDGGLMFGAGISFDESASVTETDTLLGTSTSSSTSSSGYYATVWITSANAIVATPADTLDAEGETVTDGDGIPDVNQNDDEADDIREQKVMVSGPGEVTGTADADDGANVTYVMTDEDGEETTVYVTGAVTGTVETMTETMTETTTTTTISGDGTVRNGIGSASVYVGAADGSWKLKFGTGLDAGIYKIGDIGIAGEGDSFYATNDHTIELSGSFEGADFAITSNAGDQG